MKLYNGFGNDSQCYVYGHALSISPLNRKHFHNYFLINALALIRLFMVKPVKGANIEMTFRGKTYKTTTEKDGFFKFEWKLDEELKPGVYPVEAVMIHKRKNYVTAFAKAEISIPESTAYAYISDIDDTFLISHSSNLRKRLFVLLTENARSRKPFDGVVNHYKALAEGIPDDSSYNAFFYVSSSEWNLYEYIREFSHQHELPNGVYLLNQIKVLTQLFKTGQNNHNGKFFRIVRILEAFPKQKFILLGDDSQEDPNIYASIVSHFKDQIHCVYIRSVKLNKKAVIDKLKEIEATGTLCCYFKHSAEAIRHSQEIGLIPAPKLTPQPGVADHAVPPAS